MRSGLAVLLLFVFVVGLSSCRTSKGVNDQGSYAYLPYTGGSSGNMAADGVAHKQSVDDYLARSSKAAIAGRLMLNGEIPVPLKFVQIALFGWDSKSEDFKELARMNSEVDGSFAFTRLLPAGRYELRVVDNKYVGRYEVRLTDTPIIDLIFTAEKKTGK